MSFDNYRYDAFIGGFGKYVCVGQCALWRAGLTTAIMESLQLGTLYPEINNCGTFAAKYYYSPWADKYFETKPSPKSENILIPTQERAIMETIILKENFNEGVLIEALKDYMYYHEDLSRLYEVCDMFTPTLRPLLDYWLEEAREDYDD